jgi:hypothetical protein
MAAFFQPFHMGDPLAHQTPAVGAKGELKVNLEPEICGIVREIIVALRVIEQISRIILARTGPMTACRVCAFPIAIEPMKRVA